MSQTQMQPAVKLGTVTWVDLTVADAPAVRDFYEAVVGWTPREVDMGDYADFEMLPPDNASETDSAPTSKPKAAAGICHARGGNAKLPPQWLMYVPVNDLERSLYMCEHLGGKIVHRLSAHYVLIQDPAGAVMIIYQAD
jgi:uncharacterized protein